MKMVKRTLIAIAALIISILAYSGGYNIYLNAKTTDTMVEEMCSDAKSDRLYCHCAESFGRTCTRPRK